MSLLKPLSFVWPWLLSAMFVIGLILFALDCALGAGWVAR